MYINGFGDEFTQILDDVTELRDNKIILTEGWEEKLKQYGEGLTIFQTDQCPYLAKCIPEISETAEMVYGIKPRILELSSCRDAQDSPCGFGVFGIVYNGKIIAEHMISSKRFSNIMSRELKG